MTSIKNIEKYWLALIFTFVFFQYTSSQINVIKDTVSHSKNLKFNYKQLIIPSVLIGYGLIGLESDGLQGLNIEIRNETVEDIDEKFTIDDILQYTPALSVYALNNLGIRGKNNLKDRSVILGTSVVFVFTSVTALKNITKVERPDGTNNKSFPSGHTALAFAGAEFLYQEYKDKSVWYGVSGYVVATATGAFRIYNNKHWLTDVAAGAGIGIVSTKAAYWLSPYLNKHFFKSNSNKTKTAFLLTPYYDSKQIGGSLVIGF